MNLNDDDYYYLRLQCKHIVKRQSFHKLIQQRTRGLFFLTKKDQIGQKLVKCPSFPQCFHFASIKQIASSFENEQLANKMIQKSNQRLLNRIDDQVPILKSCLCCDHQNQFFDNDGDDQFNNKAEDKKTTQPKLYAIDNDHFMCLKCWIGYVKHIWREKGVIEFQSQQKFNFNKNKHTLPCPVPECRFHFQQNLVPDQIIRDVIKPTFSQGQSICQIF